MYFSRNLLYVLILAMLPCALIAQEWGSGEGQKPVPETVTAVDPGLCKQLAENPGFSWKQRRDMGITFKNIRLKLKELKAEGKLEGLEKSEVSALVMEELVNDNPKIFENVDWDRVLKFIELLLSILIKFV